MRLTSDPNDIDLILALRGLCFGREFKVNDFEVNADHLVVEDHLTGKIVGAYRLSSSSKVSRFESELEFDIHDWLRMPGNRLELGWACTREGYREGAVIRLLWKGLTCYIKQNNITAVFGPASVVGNSVENLKGLLEYLEKNHFDLKEKLIRVRDHYDLSAQLQTTSSNKSFMKRQIPALLRAYLMAGALVLLQPIFDPDSNCFDLMTILELNQCSKPMKNHFDL
jgi:putative hemolysin